MSTSTEKFVSSFHSLSGVTIGERRKNLFLLLNHTQKSLQTSTDKIDFSLLHPKTFLEEAFKVEALIHFRRIPELVEVLKSENPILIKKVLKNSSWFLEEAFQNWNGEQLVTLVFPYVSLSVKVKIVNKLSVYLNNRRQGDLFFDAICIKYGLYLALKLLPCCSDTYILKLVEKRGKKLSPSKLLTIIKKRPELIESIFQALDLNMSKGDIRCTHYQIFIYLAKTNNPLFLNLYHKYYPSVHMGWRATHKFILANKQFIIKNSNYIHKVLHKKQTYKSLREGFSEYYLNLFPNIERFSNSFSFLFSFLSRVPSDAQKINFLEESFQKVYGTELWKNPNCLTLTFLDILPLEKRLKIKSKPYFLSDYRWTCYLGTDQSIPLIKKQISLSSDISTRTDLVGNLVETCRINKDTQALLNVCKYVLTQHRNDHVCVRFRFFKSLERSFELEKLTEEHWLYINELLQIFDMNTETFSYGSDFLLLYIHHRLLNGFKIDQYLAEFLKVRNYNWNLFKNNSVFEKHCLNLIGKLLPEIFDKDALKYRYLEYLKALINWNKRHPEDEFSILDYEIVIDSFKQTLMEEINITDALPVIIYFIRLEANDETMENLISLCLRKLESYAIRDNINWLLKHRVMTVVRNSELIAKLALKDSNSFFWRYCRNYSHLEIPQKIGTYCLEALEAKLLDVERRNAITGLSYLMNPEKFLQLSAKYYPTELKADSQTEESRIKYKCQTAIAGCFKNVIPPSLAIESILNFCKGDYLKLVYRSLYSACDNINENNLPAVLNELAGLAVSVRKHAFHLTLRTLDREHIFIMFSKFMETEKNASIRKFLFKGSFNLFLQEPNDYTWKLVKMNVEAVDRDDEEVVQMLMRVNEIPLEYIVDYVLLVWNHLEKLPEDQNDNKKQKYKFVRSLSSLVIQMLPEEFCYNIVHNYLLEFKNIKDSQQIIFMLHRFVCRFVIYCSDQKEQEKRIKVLLKAFKGFVFNGELRTFVDDFLKAFCSEFLQRHCTSREVFSTFVTLWNFYIEPHQVLDQNLYLQLCVIYIDYVNSNLSLEWVGEKLAGLSNTSTLSSMYGTVVVVVLADILKSFIKNFEKTEDTRYIIIESMIKTSTSDACLIIAICLLKTSIKHQSNMKGKHAEIVEMLKDMPNPLIQIYLNHHLHKMNI